MAILVSLHLFKFFLRAHPFQLAAFKISVHVTCFVLRLIVLLVLFVFHDSLSPTGRFLRHLIVRYVEGVLKRSLRASRASVEPLHAIASPSATVLIGFVNVDNGGYVRTRDVVPQDFSSSARKRVTPEASFYHRIMARVNSGFVGRACLLRQVILNTRLRLCVIKSVRQGASNFSFAQGTVGTSTVEEVIRH